MTYHAEGTFELVWDDQGTEQDGPNAVGRARITKTFAGDLVGTSITDIQTVTTTAGPQAYVAVERVTATLHGRKGGFILTHIAGTHTHIAETPSRRAGATDGKNWMKWSIVPTSGHGDLEGITGEGQIVVENGAHSYVLDYDLP